MKIIKNMFLIITCICFFTGCGFNGNDNIVNDLIKKVEECNSYHLSGVLEIVSNENSYLYDVDVAFLKDNYFKVSLKNKTNNHEQVILRNNDGVYVITRKSLQLL